MPDHKVKLIINPRADFGHAWEGTPELYAVSEENGGVDFTCTIYPQHAVELARQASEQGYELVIAAGGDGTTHEVINGLMQIPRERRPRLGIVPMGTGNDFSHAIGMDSQPAQALRQILSGQVKRVDIGRITDGDGRSEYFANAVGIGFDATVTFYFRKLTRLRGVMAYLVAIIKTIILHHDAPLMVVNTDVEDWEEESLMFVVCNGSREGGGFLVAPQSEPDDGVFHYARVSKVSRLMMLRLVPEVMNGTHGRFQQVSMGYFSRMDLRSDRPLHIHMDGEIFAGFDSDVQKISIEILPGEIEVMT
jgi:diacylglycerol kinase (ATP)